MAKNGISIAELLHDTRLQQLTNNCSKFGVAAAVIDYGANSDRSDGGYYVVAGLDVFPDLSPSGVSPKQLEKQLSRNDELFYLKFFAEEITPENIDTVVIDLRDFCAETEILRTLFKEFECPLPDVIRKSEAVCLLKWNEDRFNDQQTCTFREINERNLEKFFKNEKAMVNDSKYKEFMEYLRSDRYHGTMYNPKKKRNHTYFKMKGQQEIPLELLQHTGAEIVETFIQDYQIKDMKETLKYTPYVFYSVGPLEIIDHGRIKDPQYDPWKDEERYWECRRFYFKKVDEPEVASAWIRIAYEDVNTRDAIQRGIRENLPEGRPVARYVPFQNMELFLDMAKEKGLTFTFDYSGAILEPTFHKIPIMVSRSDIGTLDAILTTIDTELMKSHGLNEFNERYLKDRIDDAEVVQNAIRGADNLPEFYAPTPRSTEYLID